MNNEAGFIRAILNINHKPKHAGPAKKLLIVREMFQDFCILNMAVHLHLYLHTHTHTYVSMSLGTPVHLLTDTNI